MRVCIIGVQNIKHMTLISMYTDFFNKNSIDYDLIYIDKYGIEEKNEAKTVYRFDASKKKYNGIFGKLLKAVKFRRFAIKIINDNNYDFLVIWREQTASMLSGFLKKKYKNRYCVNIRDLWNLKNIYITHGVKDAVNSSAFNTISSKGFLEYLPQSEYLLTNSVNSELLKNFKMLPIVKSPKEPIVITYIGTLRFYDYCFDLINALKNDYRFKLKFVGQGSDVIKEFVEQNNINNVECIGAFSPDETLSLIEDADIINSAFGGKNIAEKTLMPIRFYYSIYRKCPLLSTSGTWVDQEATRLGIGISIPSRINENCNIGDVIANRYNEITNSNIARRLDDYKDEILLENQLFIKKLQETMNKIE